jgi:ferrous iron transport protein B
MCTGYTVAFLVYQIGTLLMEGTVGTGFLPGALIVGVMLGTAIYLCAEADKKAALATK